VGDTLFFTARDGIHGPELWKSDGTEAGTVLVKDIHPGVRHGEPDSLTGVGGTLFFTARDGTHGRELWKSDGTEAGTVLVKDIHPGEYDSGPSALAGVGGTLFFTARDGTHGPELWKSDGTEAGTVLVKDINAGGRFTVASNGTANTSTGTLTVKVAVAGAGRLVVRPADGSAGKLKWSVRDMASAGTTTITLRPTKAGLRILKQIGRLRITARFTFTPCGGTGSSVIRQYTLRMR
jgi:ELWxxDGT repeat protein